MGLTQKCMKSVGWGYSVCLRMCASNMTSSCWMIHERSDACLLVSSFLPNMLSSITGEDRCFFILVAFNPEPNHFWRPLLLCSTRWTVSCLDSLDKLVLKISFSCPGLIQQHKELPLCPTSKSHQHADRTLGHWHNFHNSVSVHHHSGLEMTQWDVDRDVL